MTRIVVDASVLIKLFLDEVGSIEAESALKEATEILAPDLLLAETANILWKYVRRAELTPTVVEQLIGDILQMPIHYTASRDLIESALQIATETGRTVYDALYIALAVQRQAVLLTADERLVNALATTPHAKRVRLTTKLD